MKRGFTLIELLAVIVILAIIAMIATPIVLKIINNTKGSAKEITGENYLHAVETAYADAIFKNIKVTDGNYIIMTDGNLCLGTVNENNCTGIKLDVSINGTKPTSGNIIISKGKIKGYSLTIDGKKIELSSCILSDTNNNGTGDIGEMVTCNTESFYIYNTNNNQYKLLSQYNLYVGDTYSSDGTLTPIDNPTGLQNKDAKGWTRNTSTNTNIYPLVGTVKFADDNKHGYFYSYYHGSIVEEYVNEYVKKLTDMGVKLQVVDSDNNKASLLTREDIQDLLYNGNSFSYGSLPTTYPWLYSTTYWLNSNQGTAYILYVTSFGTINNDAYFQTYYGIRPVIIINKSDIQK